MQPPSFQQFPFAYRIAQGGLAFTVILLINIRFIFKPNVPVVIRTVVGMILAAVALTALIAGYYVIIRYPFLSLVEVEGGDKFDKHFQSANGKVYYFLKLLSTIVVALLLLAMALLGLDDIRQLLFLLYIGMLLGFLTFFTFVYHPIKHPTVSTFIRATLGIGI